jgi:hypothetical protein
MNGRRAPCEVPGTELLEELLGEVKRRFYPSDDPRRRAHYYRDRRHLIHALCWPAAWLRHRGLTCSHPHYRQLLRAQLHAIGTHGDPRHYSAYFPSYLLKCLQDHFRHHGDELYEQLKHVRNALDRLLASSDFAARAQRHAEQLDVLAAAHRLTQPHPPRRPASDSSQLSLFSHPKALAPHPPRQRPAPPTPS